jgi:cytoskeletal protein CcmA (bactofilin family)
LGDVNTPVLVISEGAIFEGSCKMEKREAGRDEKISILKMKDDATGEEEEKEKEKESGP